MKHTYSHLEGLTHNFVPPKTVKLKTTMSHPETIYNGLDYKLGPQNVVKPHTQLHLWNEIAYLGKLHLCKLKFASFYQPTLVKNNPIKARITIVSVTE